MENFLEPVEEQLRVIDSLFEHLHIPKTQWAVFWGILNAYMEDAESVEDHLVEAVGGMNRTTFSGIGSQWLDPLVPESNQTNLAVWMSLTTVLAKQVTGDNEIFKLRLATALSEIVQAAGVQADDSAMGEPALMAALCSVIMCGGTFDSKAVLFLCGPLLSSINSDRRLEIITAMANGLPDFSLTG